MFIPILRQGSEGTSRDTRVLHAVTGAPLGTLHEAPAVVNRLAVKAMRTAPDTPPGEIAAVLAQAGRLFARATLGGQTPEEYFRLQALASGVPIAVARRTAERLAEECGLLADVTEEQRPAGTGPGRPARWARRGSVLAVVAPSNHPGTHIAWLQAIALGYGVAVRPGARDPITPLRLARALLEAGLHAGRLSLLPGSHAAADALVAAADLALVYGSEATVARMRGNDRVLVRGPGRSKILVDVPLDDDILDYLVAEIADDGGVRCTNATAIFTSGDQQALADALAERLAALPLLPVTDPGAELPARPVKEARALRSALVAAAQGAADVAERHYAGDPTPVIDGDAAVLRPAVMWVDRSDHPGLRTELPFPCVWVAPWRAGEGLGPLDDSLALTLLTENDVLVAEALDAPTVRTVIHGKVTGWWADPYLPHDGYLGQFLREARGFAVSTKRTAE
ncbi:aldehyde dehydrogenase family protein [Streptomyces roseifaciens]|uniref:aldehyde dehydrogenase family protein n=1 Tax=Streptomyces roseifaciens TaxID=1488406 RepID=UPI0007180BE7|nr:aldehyde dehydrogenase family protein [Streptomyces roseifaciens]